MQNWIKRNNISPLKCLRGVFKLGERMSRTVAREIAFKSIYSHMFNTDRKYMEQDDEDLFGGLSDPDDLGFVANILKTFAEHCVDINDVVKNNLVGITIDRLYKIDLAIIFVAICELFYIKENTPAVIVNEAVDLAKKFSTEKSPRFVNGFLGDLIKKAVK